ncbi:MAG TPA: hypothetical protein VFI03_07860 [Solirubrobacterales bacterium]|nr:hypothetical protein [Solirubrobacterales bacterium]
MLAWLRNYGFAALAFLAIVAAVFLAIRTEVPRPVPEYALQAQAIYRIEIGVSAFAGFYIVCLLFVSALNGRGISHFGRGGVELRRIIDETQPKPASSRWKRALARLRAGGKRR